MVELAPVATGVVSVSELENMGRIARPVDDATKQRNWKTGKWKSGYVQFCLVFEKQLKKDRRRGRREHRLVDLEGQKFSSKTLAQFGLISQSEYHTGEFRTILNSIQEADNIFEKIRNAKGHAKHMDSALPMNVIYECVVGDFQNPSLNTIIKGMLRFVEYFFKEPSERSAFTKFCLNKMFKLVTGPYSETHFTSAAVWLGGMFWRSIITVEEFVGFNMYMIQAQQERRASILFVSDTLKAIGELVDASKDVKKVTDIACLYSFLLDNYSKLDSRESFLVKDVLDQRMNGWVIPVAQGPSERPTKPTGLDWDDIFDVYQGSSSQNKPNVITHNVKELTVRSEDTKGLFSTLFRRKEEGFLDFVVDVVKVAILKPDSSASDLEELAGSFASMFPDLAESDRIATDAPKVWEVLQRLSTDEQMPRLFERFVMPFKSLKFANALMQTQELDLESGCAICKVYEKLFDVSQEPRKDEVLARAVWYLPVSDEEGCSLDYISQELEKDPNLLYVALGIDVAFSENEDLEWPDADCPEESWPEPLRAILALLKSGKLDKYGDICSVFLDEYKYNTE